MTWFAILIDVIIAIALIWLFWGTWRVILMAFLFAFLGYWLCYGLKIVFTFLGWDWSIAIIVPLIIYLIFRFRRQL